MAKWKLYKDYSEVALTTIEIDENISAQDVAEKLIAFGHIERTNIMGKVHLAPYKDIPGICLFDESGWRLARLVKVTEEPTLAQVAAQAPVASNGPKCPICGSTNLTKQTVMSRGISGFLFGRHSVEGRAQFVCNNCGYQF